jgi:tetratricopeptide (TPR) repeat protein
MRSCWRAFLVLSLTLFAGGLAALLAQQATKPLTDQELIYLLEKKVSSSALADMVQSYGVAFQADEGVLDRLKKAGASEALLEAIQRQAKRLDLQIQGTTPKPAAPEPEAVPPPAREHLQLGQQKLKNYDYQGALGEFAEAERIRPQWEEVFNQRGLAFAAMARYSEAAAEWKKYLALAPAGVDKTAIQQRIEIGRAHV